MIASTLTDRGIHVQHRLQPLLPALGSILFLLLSLCRPALAAEVPALVLQGPPQETRVEPHVSWLCDPAGLMELDDIQGRLHPLPHHVIVFGYENGTCWFHFRLENASTEALSLILQLNYPVLDRVELFAPGSAQPYREMGDSLPFVQRPIATRAYVIPLDLPAGKGQDYYLRIASTSSMNVPLTLSSTEHYIGEHETSEWIHGAGFGITIGLIVYHLFLWLAVREKIYRFYVLYMGSALFYILCFEGMAFELWPTLPGWNAHAQLFFVFLMLASGALFARDYLRTSEWPSADRILKTVAGMDLAAVALQFMLPLSLGYKLQPVLALITMLAIISVAVMRWRAGLREARLFLLSWGLLLGMATTISLQSFGAFPGLPFMLTLNGMEIAFILQQVLLALALADRLNILKQEKTAQEAAIMRAEAESAAKTEFLARMSHEIRTPMNALMGITQLLQDTSLDRVQKNYVDTLNSSGHALLNVINDILDYSKISAGKIELEMIDFNLLDLLDECIQVFSLSAREKSVSLICERGRDLPSHMRGDAGRLRQIILNLLSNAIKFTDYGNVFLRVDLEEASASRLRLRIEVEDSGIGIPAEKLPHLFESFMQADSSTSRQYGGSGLGLAISRQLVELMHGKISVSSTEGQGTLFRFTVLLKAASANPPLPDPREIPISPMLFAGTNALVVEDNPINQLVIHGFLQKVGIEARLASGGQEALDILTAGEEKFDVIFMDCEMPFMDGFETTRRLRQWERESGTPPHIIIALTAHALPEHRERCLAAGMNDYLSKPLLLARLVEKLHGILRRQVATPDQP
ncbi:MAG: 7TM diverse intracellular signaling domain-containing protein [Pedobacter sp.]|nr:7TM diverse intracellular signaling domain-containing protein [Pedobacter sp.]